MEYVFISTKENIFSYIKIQKDTVIYFKDVKDKLKYIKKEKITFHDTKEHEDIFSRNKYGGKTR